MERETDPLLLALAKEEKYDCIGIEKSHDSEMLRSKNCKDSFTADAASTFFPISSVLNAKKQDEKEPGLFKEVF